MELLRLLSEMARAPQICGNCGQPMAGNHFYRKVEGKNIRFCKQEALEKAKEQGLNPIGNVSFPAGSHPETVEQAIALQTGQQTADPQATQQAAAPDTAVKQPVDKTQQAATATSTTSDKVPGGNQQVESIKGKVSLQDVYEWIVEYQTDFEPTELSVTDDGRLNIHRDFRMYHQEFPVIPVALGKINGDFEISSPILESFKNFPTEVTGNVDIKHTDASSFDHLDIKVGGDLDLRENTSLTDLRGIQKHIKHVGGTLKIDFYRVKKGGLGILMIDGIQSVQTDDQDLSAILNKYFDDEHDLFDIQEELIEAGYKDYART